MQRYLTLVVLCFVAVSEACQPPPCHWTEVDVKPLEDYYDKVANVMILADKKAQDFCKPQGCSTCNEDHKSKHYRLIYPNPGGELFEVKVWGRALLVRAESCQGVLTDVRVLPAYVDPQKAHYGMKDGNLIITFPYKFNVVSGGGVCVPPHPSIIIVPRREITDCNSCTVVITITKV